MNKNNYWYKSEQILKLFKNKTFNSANCGLNSTERRNLKRVSNVVEALSGLNSWNMKGESVLFFEMLKMSIDDYMKKAGFERYISRDKIAYRRIKK